jgi:hypothetical protein
MCIHVSLSANIFYKLTEFHEIYVTLPLETISCFYFKFPTRNIYWERVWEAKRGRTYYYRVHDVNLGSKTRKDILLQSSWRGQQISSSVLQRKQRPKWNTGVTCCSSASAVSETFSCSNKERPRSRWKRRTATWGEQCVAMTTWLQECQWIRKDFEGIGRDAIEAQFRQLFEGTEEKYLSHYRRCSVWYSYQTRLEYKSRALSLDNYSIEDNAFHKIKGSHQKWWNMSAKRLPRAEITNEVKLSL